MGVILFIISPFSYRKIYIFPGAVRSDLSADLKTPDPLFQPGCCSFLILQTGFLGFFCSFLLFLLTVRYLTVRLRLVLAFFLVCFSIRRDLPFSRFFFGSICLWRIRCLRYKNGFHSLRLSRREFNPAAFVRLLSDLLACRLQIQVLQPPSLFWKDLCLKFFAFFKGGGCLLGRFALYFGYSAAAVFYRDLPGSFRNG